MMDDAPARAAIVPLPGEFFDDVLPAISDLAELKAVLSVARLAAESHRPGARLSRLLAPDVLRVLAPEPSPEPAERRLQRTLDRAVANGSLLRLTLREPDHEEQYYLPASSRSRDLIERLGVREDIALQQLDITGEAEISLYRPNVFSLFEQHIGPLTPLVAEQLRDAERSYPRAWIEEAILEAVHYNKRTWRYVESILVQWETAGGPPRPFDR